MHWITTVHHPVPGENQVQRFTFHAKLKNDHTVLELFSAEAVETFPGMMMKNRPLWHWLRYKAEQNTVPRPPVPESVQATVLERFLETTTVES